MQMQLDQRGLDGGVMQSKVKPEGHEIRKALLASAFEAELKAALAARIPRLTQRDDVVDAFAALWSARRIARGSAIQLPKQTEADTEIDSTNLPMVVRY